MMKKILSDPLFVKGGGRIHWLLSLLLFVSVQTVSAQVFWQEDFSNGCTANCNASTYTGPNGAWTVSSLSAEGASANKWYVSCAEEGKPAGVCGTGCSSNDPSLHMGAGGGIGDLGASYNATGAANVTDKRAESPLINCSAYSNITVDFDYIGQGQSCTTDFCDFQVSTDGGTSWSNVQTCMTSSLCGAQGLWQAFSTTLPAACNNNPNVKIGFHWKNNGDGVGTDPSFAVDSIRLSVVTSTNTITTGTIAGSPFCACSTLNVPFTSTGTFTAGNVYTAQLSNAAGSFAAPTTIGTLASTANTGTIPCTIPCATVTGTGYRIRVISSAPVVTGTDNGVDLTINATVTPSVSIVSSPTPATICAGDPVTFTATPTNGGTTPGYQWQVNGTNVSGATSSTFTSTTLTNGDVVTVVMTSTATCPSPATATSNSITITVTASAPASVTIVSSPSPAVICAGDPVVFTATPTNGGATPGYQWQVNGTNVAGETASTFTSTSLANGDVVTVVMTSSSSCATGSPATSNSITITISASTVASVAISASPAGTICSGQSVTFTAVPTNGGATPTYQWQLNGSNVPGETAATYTTTGLTNGDVVTVVMTSSSSCATGSPATSNAITMTVNSSVTPLVSIAASSTTICLGDPVTFTATATNGGSSPSYQWQVNGSNAGTNSATFTSSSLSNGDVVTVTLTSNAPCASPTTAGSNTISITVNNCNPPVANFTADNTTFCTSGCVNFTDLSTGTPTSWSWSFPGASPSSSTAQNPTNICYSANGSYSVTLIVTNANGSDTLIKPNYITVGVPTQVSIVGNTAINACESTTLGAYPADGTYTWGPNVNILCEECQSATVAPTSTTNYWVTYTSPDGCVDSDTVTVTVTNIYNYFMPTGFSPNGDGINDVIQVHGKGIDYINLKIFDRIGEKVFETSDIDQGWDGKLLGDRMNDNVFVYMLEVTYCNGETVKEQGNITLVR